MTQNFAKEFDGSNMQESMRESLDWFSTQENSEWGSEGVGTHYYQYYFEGCDVIPAEAEPLPNIWTTWRAVTNDCDDS